MTEPTSADLVSDWYIAGRRTENPFWSDAELVVDFDRWLADHDKQIKAEAWDEGCRHGGTNGYAPRRNPYLAEKICGWPFSADHLPCDRPLGHDGYCDGDLG